MELSDHEMNILGMIENEVDIWLKSTNFKSNPTKSNITRVLEKTLPQLTAGKMFTVSINESSRDPFIMAIYPDIEELDRKSNELSEILGSPRLDNAKYIESWNGIKKWTMEIDVRILMKGGPICVRTGSEFVAVLCHEIGHVMIEDPFEMVFNYQKRKATLDRFNKMAAIKSKFVRKMMLPMFVNTLSFRIVNRGHSLQRELSADGYVPEKYRGSLIDYIENCISVNPEASGIVMTKEDYRNEQEMSIRFSEEALTLLRDRSEVLKDQIHAQYNGCSGSNYHKKLMKFLGKTVAAYDPEKGKTNLIMEGTLRDQLKKEIAVCEQYAEAALEATQCTDRDLTILEVQCAEVKTTEDKIYLIHTIYDFIEAIQKENARKLEKSKDPKVKDFIKNDTRLSRLNKCREIVMNKNTTDVGDRYGVFVKYPKGYEG